MKVMPLTCPACGSPLSRNLTPNQQHSCPACGSILVLTDLVTADQNLCPQCNTANSEANKFCAKCGVALRVTCPLCYTANEVGALCCRNCGANLQHAQRRMQAWLAEKREHDAARLAASKQAEAEGRKAELQVLLDQLDEPANHPMAIYRLHQIGAEAVGSLVGLLKDDDPDARYGAAQTLGLIGDPQAIPELIEALADPEVAVRYWAVDALGKLRAATAVQAIGRLLHDKHEGVRARAAQALREIGTPGAEQLLEAPKVRKWLPLG